MAKYTMELRTIIENGINIFDFPYEFYDDGKRTEFEQDFIRHFYFREIGVETIDKFKWYLEDKMKTVFPYYNKLLQASEVEYDLLDHYRLEETIIKEIDNKNAVSGVSSSVGRFTGEQENLTETDETGNNKSNTVNTGEDETIETTSRESTVKKNGTVTTESEQSAEKENINKFLDTPQGQLNLNDSKYLTELRQDNGTEKTSGTSTAETDETVTTDESGNANVTKNSSFNSDVEDNTTTNTISESITTDTQQSTQDINSRTQSNGSQKEVSKLIRAGNIGVQTDAEGIEKHVLLRKTLDNLKRMFFDECEDLFMGVY